VRNAGIAATHPVDAGDELRQVGERRAARDVGRGRETGGVRDLGGDSDFGSISGHHDAASGRALAPRDLGEPRDRPPTRVARRAGMDERDAVRPLPPARGRAHSVIGRVGSHAVRFEEPAPTVALVLVVAPMRTVGAVFDERDEPLRRERLEHACALRPAPVQVHRDCRALRDARDRRQRLRVAHVVDDAEQLYQRLQPGRRA
jgi:hypothetical protein